MIEIFVEEPTCEKCGDAICGSVQEETAEALLFDCEALAQVRFNVFSLGYRKVAFSKKTI